MIASLTDLRPLLIALVEVLEVLDLDPVLQRGEVKVGQGVHRPRVRGLRLVVHGGQAATAPSPRPRPGGEYAHAPRLVTSAWSLVTDHMSGEEMSLSQLYMHLCPQPFSLFS